MAGGRSGTLAVEASWCQGEATREARRRLRGPARRAGEGALMVGMAGQEARDVTRACEGHGALAMGESTAHEDMAMAASRYWGGANGLERGWLRYLMLPPDEDGCKLAKQKLGVTWVLRGCASYGSGPPAATLPPLSDPRLGRFANSIHIIYIGR